MYPPKKIVIPEWSLPSYSRRNEIPEVIALVRIRREILAVERQSGIVLYWNKCRVSFIFFFILLLLHIELVLAWLSYIYFYISFFFLSSSSLPSLLFSFLSLLFSYLFFLFFFVSFFFLQIRAQVAITLVGILERRSRGKFFQNLVVKHGRKMLLISR